MKASPSQRGFVRMSAMKALCFGFPHNQAARLYDVSKRTLSRLVRWFNDRGVDGLIDRPKPGRPKKIGPEKSAQYRELIQNPEKADQTGVEGDPRPRRRLAMRGEKISVPYEGSYVRMNVTGMGCPRTGEFYRLICMHKYTQVFQVFLDHANADIPLQRKRNILICDNASRHKSSSLNRGNFERVLLPPYSPDLNPIERLWLLMKAEWFSDFIAKDRDQLIDRLSRALNWVVDRGTKNSQTFSIRTEL